MYNEISNNILSKIRRNIDMAMNPMQRKANNYLLIGILGTLLVTGLIIVFLFIQLNNLKQDAKNNRLIVKQYM